MKIGGMCILVWMMTTFCHAQSQLLHEQAVLEKILSLQVGEDLFYDSGMFQSKRNWFNHLDPVDDNNVFFTASIAFILRTIRERRDSYDSVIISIINKANSNYYKYVSRNGEATYNFWQTIGDDLPFPNGSIFLTTKKNRMPDDYGVTAMVELAKNDKNSADLVRKKMISYASRKDRKQVENTLDQYREYNAYEVWFADKMNQEYDVVVMSNVLSFVFRGQYELNQADRETIHLIQRIVNDNTHFTEPETVSPYYRTTPWILYHLARLLADDFNNVMGDIRPKIIQDIGFSLEQTSSQMEKLLLYTSLYRLGLEPDPNISMEGLQKEINSFIFFQNKPTQLFGTLPVMKWKSEAFNWTLVLEFLSFSQLSSELSE